MDKEDLERGLEGLGGSAIRMSAGARDASLKYRC